MKEVQDRVVQFSNRYKLTDVDTGTELGTYDFEEVTGTVQQVGTEIDKELFDSIAADLTANAAAISTVDEKADTHIERTDNPHTVTKAQVGLGNVANERQYSASNPPPYPVVANGSYPNMTVGNATKLNDKAASEYALKSDIKTRIYSIKKSVYPYKWESKTWNAWDGCKQYDGQNIWTDGENIYYSSSANQYVLNRETSTWEAKTWNGFNPSIAAAIWTDGNDIYFSRTTDQYVLNRETSTWEAKTWNGLTDFYGHRIWTDGKNIYYSNSTDNYVLNRETSTWETKTWNGLTSLNVNGIWTDGENIYYSLAANHYVLNRETSTWESKTWNGFNDVAGVDIWTDGENIYYSSSANQYVLNRETSTWETKTWNGLTSLSLFDGRYIWTDGNDIYFSALVPQYKLTKAIPTTLTTLRR